jgi:hypothetical protein
MSIKAGISTYIAQLRCVLCCAVLCWTICTFHFSQFASTIQDGARLASHPSVCHVRCLGANSTRQDCSGCGGTACWCMCVCSVYSSVVCIAIRVLQQYRDELSYNEEIIQLHPILSHPIQSHSMPFHPTLSYPILCRAVPLHPVSMISTLMSEREE